MALPLDVRMLANPAKSLNGFRAKKPGLAILPVETSNLIAVSHSKRWLIVIFLYFRTGSGNGEPN